MGDTLRALIDASRSKEAEELVPRVSEPSVEPGRWSTKDVLAHLSAWRSIATAELEAVRTGGAGPDVTFETDDENQRIYDATHGWTAEEVVAEAARSWNALKDAVAASTEEVLDRPRLRRPTQPSWQGVLNNTYLHLVQHLDWWHSERGEDVAGESAALWAHDLATESFPEVRRRAIADYNLACYYATHGRAYDALPLLGRAFELSPDLAEFARSDSDLDPIRAAPGASDLLA